MFALCPSERMMKFKYVNPCVSSMNNNEIHKQLNQYNTMEKITKALHNESINHVNSASLLLGEDPSFNSLLGG